MGTATAILFIGLLVFLAHTFAGVFSRTKIPDVLWLILIGLLLGPVSGLINPGYFGAVGPIFTSVTLVVILFEGGIEMNLAVLRKAMGGTLSLTLANFFVTLLAVGGVTLLMTDLGPSLAFMLGAILGGTSSIVVIPLVRQLQMGEEGQSILSLESALTDVLCIVSALALLEAHKAGELSFRLTVGYILSSIILAIILGVVSAFAWATLAKRVRALQNAIFTTPAFVFVVFGIGELLGYSGAIASLAFGVALGNIELFNISALKRYIRHETIALNETEKAFFAEGVFLLKTFFFVYIGVSIQLTNLWWVSIGAILTLLVFALRIPVVRFSVPKSISATDASLMAVMVPKGLAAAVLASIPLQQGVVGGELISNATYTVILFSIILTSLLVFLVSRTRLSKFYGRVFSGFGTPLQREVEAQASASNNPGDTDGEKK